MSLMKGMEMEMETGSGDGGGKSEVVVYRIRQQKKLPTTAVMMSAKTKAFYGGEGDAPFLVLFAGVHAHLLLLYRLLRCSHPDLHRFPHHHQLSH